MKSATTRLRCAVYTRKSSEEGLEQDFNSLDAQREACIAYIASQVGLGWTPVPTRYDDGGISGATMERPALQRLLQDIRDRKVDVVVVYKIDRLTRSLMDFSKIVEIFDASSASFVSVTQQFNTTTSMGRLTLNVLLSFAQFEREVTAERIRDKIAASKKKGMWMGGTIPLGYRLDNRKLIPKEPEASYVRKLFQRYIELRSVPTLVRELNEEHRLASSLPAGSSQDAPYTRRVFTGMIYKLLANPLYIGKLKHLNDVHPGEHDGLVDPGVYETVQRLLAEGSPNGKGKVPQPDAHQLTGLLCDERQIPLRPVHGRNHGRRYRYYISRQPRDGRATASGAWRIPTSTIEPVVLKFLCSVLRDGGRIADWSMRTNGTSSVQKSIRDAGDFAAILEGGCDLTHVRSTIRSVYKQITLGASKLTFVVDIAAVMSLIQPANGSSALRESDDNEDSLFDTIELPIAFKSRGLEKRIVVLSSIIPPTPDASLVDLVARAHLYLNHMTSAAGAGTSGVASYFNVDPVEVGRILPLAFLSPTSLAALLEGNNTRELSSRTLARIDLPNLWSAQDQLLA